MTTQNISSEVQGAIQASNRKFMESFNRGDAAGMAVLYTENGQLLPTGLDFVTGHSAIQSFWQGAMDMGIKTASLETVEMEGFGDTVMEVGRYTLGGEGEQVLDKGKFIVIWKEQGGQWKLHRDIFNSSMPPQEA